MQRTQINLAKYAIPQFAHFQEESDGQQARPAPSTTSLQVHHWEVSCLFLVLGKVLQVHCKLTNTYYIV